MDTRRYDRYPKISNRALFEYRFHMHATKTKKHNMANERNEIINKEVEALVRVGVMRAMQFP